MGSFLVGYVGVGHWGRGKRVNAMNRRFRILIVEDNDTDLMAMKRELEERFDLLIARSIEEALPLVDKCDVALVDLRLPPHIHEETMELLVRPYCDRVCMYILSRMKGDEEIFAAGESGVAGYFVKEGPIWETVRHQMLCTWARRSKLGDFSRAMRSP